MTQVELMIKLLFDPRIDLFTIELVENDEEFAWFVNNKNNNPHKFLESLLLTSEIKFVENWDGIINDQNIDNLDFTGLPKYLDGNYEDIFDFHKSSGAVFEGFERENEVHSWNFFLKTLESKMIPFYKELQKKRLLWTLAVNTKYPKKEIYDFLLTCIDIPIYEFKKIYVVGNNANKNVFIEMPSVINMTDDEAKQFILNNLKPKKEKRLPDDMYFKWFCWSKHKAKYSDEEILNEWCKQDKVAQYNEDKQARYHRKTYKEIYIDYFLDQKK